MEAALRSAFTVRQVAITDDSAQHAGHAGAAPGGETHYTVEIVADEFTGKSRVARHRAVNAALSAEFDAGLHALALIIRAPEE